MIICLRTYVCKQLTIALYFESENNLEVRTLVKSAYQKIFSYFSTKTYVVGTQKNLLDETVLLSTQNICLNWSVRKY